MNTMWDYANVRQYLARLDEGMPPVVITCAITGGHQKSDNPHVPVTAEEQADEAARVAGAGARIVHIHGHRPDDPTKESNDPDRYCEIAELVRAKAPGMLLDFTQTVAPFTGAADELVARTYYYKSSPIKAKPDIMALNPGPMTFRGTAEWASGAYVASFDDTERTANLMREHGIKPQVFLYHPGHLDLLAHLIARDALSKPYFVQLVFGQQSGINAGLDSVLYMVRHLPPDCIFQTCALDLSELQVNVLSLLLGGHVRCGMEDAVLYTRNEPATGNVQLVERIVRIAGELGRAIATPAEARKMLGLSH